MHYATIRIVTVSAAALVGLAAIAADAADPADKCESGKLKESAKYASCRLKAESKAILKATTPDFTKCESKFTPKFNALETKAGMGVCPTEGDEPGINARITGDAADIALRLSGACPGAVVAGSCWIWGGVEESCDTACANVDLSYDAATRTFSGSDGTLANCAAVLNALGAPPPSTIENVGPDSVGCFTDGSTAWRRDPVNTTSSQSWPTIRRACACQ
jgi:hypothetical protein